MWNAAMGLFGVVFWLYGILTLLWPAVFAPHGYMLGILGVLLALYFLLTGWLAGTASVGRVWDEGAEHDSNRAYKFGFTMAWCMYLVFWLLLARGWISLEATFPAMGAFTGGSYCLYMGITGLRGWYETRHAPD